MKAILKTGLACGSCGLDMVWQWAGTGRAPTATKCCTHGCPEFGIEYKLPMVELEPVEQPTNPAGA